MYSLKVVLFDKKKFTNVAGLKKDWLGCMNMSQKMTKNREKTKILLNDFQHLVQEYLHTINKIISLVTK